MYIDFVLLWVDGNDPAWQEQYKIYAPSANDENCNSVRYRDYELLKYWFRGVERFSPWVRKIHFVTSGHYPAWLNINHEKLNFVKHSEFIPEQYLPTFNSHTIELNIHRIKGLAENFVYFNDDFFLTNKIDADYFFNPTTGKPKDCLIFNPIVPGGISHIVMNCVETINKYYSKSYIIKKNNINWLNLKYGKDLLRNILLFPWPELVGFKDTHLPTAFCKSVFEHVWDVEFQLLNQTCHSRFRKNSDVNQYLMRYWQLASGNFEPKNLLKDSTYLDLGRDNIDFICKVLNKQNKKIVVINDAEIDDFEHVKSKLAEAFELILPEKSIYEI